MDDHGADAPDPAPRKEGCRWCGEQHGRLCPNVKALEFSEANGRIIRVEFMTMNDVPQDVRNAAVAEPPPTYPRKPSSTFGAKHDAKE